jgi:hypothetical protein
MQLAGPRSRTRGVSRERLLTGAKPKPIGAAVCFGYARYSAELSTSEINAARRAGLMKRGGQNGAALLCGHTFDRR